jgi:hypothetical protein
MANNVSKDNKADMFGISAEPEVEMDDEGEDTEDVDYVIHQIIPADPAWRAAFDGEGPDGQSPRIVPLACFALIEVTGEDAHRAVRPMIADELGRIDDVEAFENFVCLVPPGALPKTVIEYVRQRRVMASGEAEA